MEDKKVERPDCAIKGFIRHPSGAMAMCGAVIVGDKSCGYAGKCEHQRPKKEVDSEENSNG